MGDSFTEGSAIRLIRFGHHLVGGAPDLLVSEGVVTVEFDCCRPCIDILLVCLCLGLIQANVCRVLLPGNLPQSNTLPVLVLVALVDLGGLGSVL